jgi:4-amino-4-deoxy-L-arabinose transferase-like glycosyltransferase
VGSTKTLVGLHAAAAASLIVLASVLRLLYLLFDCPYDLSPDEAHYWDWARHFDWSYYSKGPGVAWLIRASTEAFGTSMWAVRLPAVVCGGLTLLGIYVLTWRVYRNASMALGVVALALTMPVLSMGSLLMTIDAPYVCCWTWALVVAHTAIQRHRPAWWVLLGFAVGVGILFKYTMVIFLPSLALFILIRRRNILISSIWFLISSSIAGLCCLPILIWNAQHGWITFLHVGRQAGVQGAASTHWLGPLEYLAGQAAVLLGFWFIPYVAVMALGSRLAVRSALDRDQTTDNEQRSTDVLFLWCLSAPMFLVFLGFSWKTDVELNWPVTAYVSGMVLAAGWIVQQCLSPITWYRRLARGCVGAAALAGIVVSAIILHTEWLYPLKPSSDDLSMRRYDPTCRLRGWRTLAGEIEALRQALRQEGVEPIIATSGWALPGEIAFYLPDHPEVYSFALATGGRRSQYDFWRPNPIWDPEQFHGVTVIYVGDTNVLFAGAFDRVEPGRLVVHKVSGHHVAAWRVTVCRGYRGFPRLLPGGY